MINFFKGVYSTFAKDRAPKRITWIPRMYCPGSFNMNYRDVKLFSSHLPFWLFVSFAIGITLGFFCSVFYFFTIIAVLAVFLALVRQVQLGASYKVTC